MQKLENLGIIGLLRCSVGNPRRGVDLRQGVGYLAAVRPRCQNGTPPIRRDVAKLRRGEGLRRGVDIVLNKQLLDCCFESLIFVNR